MNRHILSFALRQAANTLAFLLLPVVAIVASIFYHASTAGPAADAARGATLPSASRQHDPEKLTAVFLVGNQGTEITDLLPPFATIGASEAFNMYTVAPQRERSSLISGLLRPTGLALEPDFSTDDYDAAFPQAPDLIVIPYIPAYQEADRALVEWVRRRAGPDTVILTVCAGTTLLAETGLLQDGPATSHYRFIDGLRQRHPETEWREGVRFVQDDRFISSAALLTGIDASLAAVRTLVGAEGARRAAEAIHFPLADTADEPAYITPRMGPLLILHAGLHWRRPEVGLRLEDGADEMLIAAAMDMLSTSLSARVRSFAEGTATATVQSRYGLRLVPELSAASSEAFETVFDAAPTTAHPTRSAHERVLDWLATERGTFFAAVVADHFGYPVRDALSGASGTPQILLRLVILGGVGLCLYRMCVDGLSRRRSEVIPGSAAAS